MKLLALSDLHGDYSHVKALNYKAGKIDAVLIAGDLTDFGPDEKALELLAMFTEPVLAIPGNCDPPSIMGLLDEKGVNLHKSKRTIDDITFIGLGGSNPTPFNTPFELPEDEMAENVDALFQGLEGRIILLSHAPPKNTLDKLPYGNVGSTALAQAPGKCDLIVCGHIHEARGTRRVNGTLVVNPGVAANGEAAVITINDKISAGFIDSK
ncbi:MAG: metallophosphoesterase family protein [Candidatus Methanoperedenaceae archaeon]|nr:metallophosphoesterase family protein [Candidatus Methanoperedenaceae archaeon]